MSTVIVQRGAGDKPGPDIVDDLLSAVPMAVERGRNEIDRQCSNRRIVNLTGPYRSWIDTGSLVEVRGRRGTYRGMVIRTALVVKRDGDSFQADMAIDLECEA